MTFLPLLSKHVQRFFPSSNTKPSGVTLLLGTASTRCVHPFCLTPLAFLFAFILWGGSLEAQEASKDLFLSSQAQDVKDVQNAQDTQNGAQNGKFARLLEKVPAIELQARLEDDYLTIDIQIPESYHLNRDLLALWDVSQQEHRPLVISKYPPVSGQAQGISYYTGGLRLKALIPPPLLGQNSPPQAPLQTANQRANQETAEFSLRYQLCLESGLCFLPQTLSFQAEKAAKTSSPSSESTLALAEQPKGAFSELVFYLWLAILSIAGGVVLNFMPCIFPILSLKIQNFLRNPAGLSIRVRLGLQLLGIELCFLALAWAIRTIGGVWGFHLQQPMVLAFIILFSAAMGLSALGVFHTKTLPIPSFLIPKKKPTGSWSACAALYEIWQGCLIVILGTPCATPILAPLLGLFLLQGSSSALSGYSSFGGFALIGLGLWLPYALLSFLSQHSPARSMRWQQRIQSWSGILEPLLGFLLFAVALFFYNSFQLQTQKGSSLLWVLLSLSLLCWGLGLWQKQRSKPKLQWLCLPFLLLFIFSIWWFNGKIEPAQLAQTAQLAGHYQGYSGAEQVSSFQKQGFPVFVEYTAEWCITCKLNEKRLLKTQAFRELLEQYQVRYLRADLTLSQPRLEQDLARFGRASLPLYLLYLPERQAPYILGIFPTYRNFTERLQ